MSRDDSKTLVNVFGKLNNHVISLWSKNLQQELCTSILRCFGSVALKEDLKRLPIGFRYTFFLKKLALHIFSFLY